MRAGVASSRSERDWLKPRELAAREGVSRRTLWRWAQKDASILISRVAPRRGVRMRLRDERET